MHQIDFYDLAEALLGFQRSLAITTHLVLNGKVITKAPALKGARIFAHPPKAGSWEIMASITASAGGLYMLGTAPKDSPIGHLVFSAYDYIVKLTLGVNVDYEKSLGVLVEEKREQIEDFPRISQGDFDAAAEKCENAIAEMHRPIVQQGTATTAQILDTRYSILDTRYSILDTRYSTRA